uniref:Uncharacterized protein n=2 Tax=Schistocephalus solidus TaxID=70667 RepID=A0A0X3QDL3_SCHSO
MKQALPTDQFMGITIIYEDVNGYHYVSSVFFYFHGYLYTVKFYRSAVQKTDTMEKNSRMCHRVKIRFLRARPAGKPAWLVTIVESRASLDRLIVPTEKAFEITSIRPLSWYFSHATFFLFIKSGTGISTTDIRNEPISMHVQSPLWTRTYVYHLLTFCCFRSSVFYRRFSSERVCMSLPERIHFCSK